MQLSPVSSIHSEEICSLSELFLHSEGEKPCTARAHFINHPDKWSLGQKKIQNGNSCDLGSVSFLEFCYGNVLTNYLKYKCLECSPFSSYSFDWTCSYQLGPAPQGCLPSPLNILWYLVASL